jgi:ketosteroid isomerase-like protein
MKKLFLILFVLTGCRGIAQSKIEAETAAIVKTLNSWHRAAAEAKFDLYFSYMTTDAVFIGTDPTENWQNDAFKAYAKPYFDNGKAWSFTAIQRNVYISEAGDMAWFDELLDTPNMKICRGSGVLKKQNSKWKIAHYVLSMAIPNENTEEVSKIKSGFDDQLIKQLQSK